MNRRICVIQSDAIPASITFSLGITTAESTIIIPVLALIRVARAAKLYDGTMYDWEQLKEALLAEDRCRPRMLYVPGVLWLCPRYFYW